jgi:hypothetical protein
MTTEQYVWSGLTPQDAAYILADLDCPWWIAGGWAIDLHLGRETRQHADLDIAMLRGDEVALRDVLAGWEIAIVHDGAFLPWGGAPLDPPMHQFWTRRDAAGPWDLEVLLEDHDDTEWLCRRDHRVAAPLDAFGRGTSSGIPYVAPEIALLYKAKGRELEKNAADFTAALPSLDAAARTWLRDALKIAHPGHPWIALL